MELSFYVDGVNIASGGLSVQGVVAFNPIGDYGRYIASTDKSCGGQYVLVPEMFSDPGLELTGMWFCFDMKDGVKIPVSESMDNTIFEFCVVGDTANRGYYMEAKGIARWVLGDCDCGIKCDVVALKHLSFGGVQVTNDRIAIKVKEEVPSWAR